MLNIYPCGLWRICQCYGNGGLCGGETGCISHHIWFWRFISSSGTDHDWDAYHGQRFSWAPGGDIWLIRISSKGEHYYGAAAKERTENLFLASSGLSYPSARSISGRAYVFGFGKRERDEEGLRGLVSKRGGMGMISIGLLHQKVLCSVFWF